MNGVHDMGGLHGFGPIRPETGEPVFHQAWEQDVFASVIALMAQGVYNLDEFRHAVERIGAAHYLDSSYYDHWLSAAELVLCEKGVIDQTELDRRIAEIKADPDAHARPPAGGEDPLAEALTQGLQAGLPAHREVAAGPRFAVGDRVVTNNLQPAGHIRLPAYVRDKPGVVVMTHGAHVLPDTHAHDGDESPAHLYTVRFDGERVWGEAGADRPAANHVDLWEPYLSPA
ncbi:nitrile hydratase subunit beta [Spectribacter hydrogenoxidans]|uniref:Nitrile hydratase subunit beta n=1 Tax=Spectribacter hydrogenoxidans TaxID=3075608 RepID=A0ABU3BWW2_9GAMM|nr:nitrile hydratase subunit beta [Salinisphaera sp. W335]MDT0633606.1 nitrile hydratase subunit beta [Salinisphaera sp. W335]